MRATAHTPTYCTLHTQNMHYAKVYIAKKKHKKINANTK